MGDRSITVNVKAVVSDFERGMSRAEQKTREFDRSVSGLIKNNRREMQALGIAGAAMGAAVAGGFVASAKAAMSWESAFAGVVKTVDATAAELSVLERGLRDMALQIPATHEELAGIAEAAGQLGIEVPNILSFTRTMADLGVATNLTSEEAAVLFARFANITGLDQTMFSNLGSSVVELGNNMATTEREIGEMALRIAAAGSQVGLTEAEILGFAAALSSVGIEAQAGGTAISRVFIEIDKAVRAGGDRLEVFAKTAGMTADQFAAAYGQNAAGAMIAFIKGLRGVSDAGGDVFGILEDLSLQDIRVRDALLRAAGAGDKFRQALELSSDAFKENNALSKEAEQRYKTAESQLTLMWNAVKEAAIAFGEIFLPVLVQVAGWIKNVAMFFAGLPDPIKNVVGIVGALVGAFAGIGGAALLLGPRIFDLVKAWQALRAAMLAAKAAEFVPTIPGGFGAPGLGATAAKAIPIVGAGVAVGAAISEAVKLSNDINKGQATLAQQLAKLMRAAEMGDQQAAEKLRQFHDEHVRSRGFWTDIGDRLDFTGVRHQSQEIWKQAEALAAVGMAGQDTLATFTELDAMGSKPWIKNAGDQAGKAADEFFTLGRAVYTAVDAQRSLNNLYAESLNPISRAVGAVQRLRDAEDELKRVQNDKKASDEDLALAQFNYVEALINTQVALDSLDYADQKRAIELFQAALGLTKDETAELLELLGVMDGTRIAMYIDMYEQVKKSTPPNKVGGPSFTPEIRAIGGPVSRGSVYQVAEQNMPEVMAGPHGMYLIPGDAGRMFSNRDIRTLINAFQGGGSGKVVNQNITLQGTGSPHSDAQLVGATASVLRMVEGV